MEYTLDQGLFQTRPSRGHRQAPLDLAPEAAHLSIVTHIDLPGFRALPAERGG